MDRGNHYEVAFEAYLQAHRLCYVAVDETRRAIVGDAPIKSLDFMVFADSARLVVDIKGRRFPGGTPSKPRPVWECWASREDVTGLEQWSEVAGPGFRGLLVFAYLLGDGVEMHPATADLFECRGRRYLFRAVDAVVYRDHMVRRSPRWDTVTLANADFRRIVRPFGDFLRAAEPLPMDEELPF